MGGKGRQVWRKWPMSQSNLALAWLYGVHSSIPLPAILPATHLTGLMYEPKHMYT